MQESPEREATEQKASSSLRPIRVKNGEKVLTPYGPRNEATSLPDDARMLTTVTCISYVR